MKNAILKSLILLISTLFLNAAHASEAQGSIAASKIRNFLNLQPGIRYVYQGLLNKNEVTVKRREEKIDVETGSAQLMTGKIIIGPLENSSRADQNVDSNQSFVIAADSPKFIKMQLINPVTNEVIQERDGSLDQIFFVSGPSDENGREQIETEESDNKIVLHRTFGSLHNIMSLEKNNDGSLTVEQKTYFKTFGIKSKTIDFYKSDYKND